MQNNQISWPVQIFLTSILLDCTEPDKTIGMGMNINSKEQSHGGFVLKDWTSCFSWMSLSKMVGWCSSPALLDLWALICGFLVHCTLRSQSIYHHWSLSRSNNNSINSAENDRHHQQQCKRCKVINIRKNVGVDITGTVVTRQFWNA